MCIYVTGIPEPAACLLQIHYYHFQDYMLLLICTVIMTSVLGADIQTLLEL